MLEKVLSIRTAILHLTDNANEFGMQAMNTKIDGSALTCLDNLVLKLFLHFLHSKIPVAFTAKLCHNKLTPFRKEVLSWQNHW